MVIGEQAARGVRRAARRSLAWEVQVVVREVDDGGRALAKAREYLIARFLPDILRETGGERCCAGSGICPR